MNNKFWVVLIGLIVVLGGLYFVLNDNYGTTKTDDLTDGTGEVIDEIPDGYTRYENDELGFSIIRLNDSEISEEGEGRIKIMHLGPGNPPNSEITNGFTVTIYKESLATSTVLEDYAESKVAQTKQQDSPILSELEFVRIADMSAYKYSFRNVLESVTSEYIFLPQPNVGYVVSYTISDPNNSGYEDMVNRMIDSLEFK
jgi:hypothetical protein